MTIEQPSVHKLKFSLCTDDKGPLNALLQALYHILWGFLQLAVVAVYVCVHVPCVYILSIPRYIYQQRIQPLKL